MGNEIIKITLKGGSGYCALDEAYEDKLTLTATSISYEYKPQLESELNRARKWSYRTDSSAFGDTFTLVANLVSELLTEVDIESCCDGGMYDFTLTYADRTRKHVRYWSDGDRFAVCFRQIRQLIPKAEPIPVVLWTREDEYALREYAREVTRTKRLEKFLAALERGECGEWRKAEGARSTSAPVYKPFIRVLEKDILESDLLDQQYLSNIEAVRGLDISKLTRRQIGTYLTYIFRAERFSEGAILKHAENGILPRLLRRLLETT